MPKKKRAPGRPTLKLPKKPDGGPAAHAIAKRLRELRLASGLNQARAAERIGIAQGPLSDLERGKYLPSLPTVAGIIRAFGLTWDQFLPPAELVAAEPEKPTKNAAKMAS